MMGFLKIRVPHAVIAMSAFFALVSAVKAENHDASKSATPAKSNQTDEITRLEEQRKRIFEAIARLNYYRQKSSLNGLTFRQGKIPEAIRSVDYDAEDEHRLELEIILALGSLGTSPIPPPGPEDRASYENYKSRKGTFNFTAALRHCYQTKTGQTKIFTYREVDTSRVRVTAAGPPKAGRAEYLSDVDETCLALIRFLSIGPVQDFARPPQYGFSSPVNSQEIGEKLGLAESALFSLSLASFRIRPRPNGATPEELQLKLARALEKKPVEVDVEALLVRPSLDAYLQRMKGELEKKRDASQGTARDLYSKSLRNLETLGADLRDPKKRALFRPTIDPATNTVHLVPTYDLLQKQRSQSLHAGVNIVIGGEPRQPRVTGRELFVPPPMTEEESLNAFLLFGAADPKSLVKVHQGAEPPIRGADDVLVDLATWQVAAMKLPAKAIAKNLFKEVTLAAGETAKDAVTHAAKNTFQDFVNGDASAANALNHLTDGASSSLGDRYEGGFNSSAASKAVKAVQSARALTAEPVERFTPSGEPLTLRAGRVNAPLAGSAAQALKNAAVVTKLPESEAKWVMPWLRESPEALSEMLKKDSKILPLVGKLFTDTGKDLAGLHAHIDRLVRQASEKRISLPKVGDFLQEASREFGRLGVNETVTRELEKAGSLLTAAAKLPGTTAGQLKGWNESLQRLQQSLAHERLVAEKKNLTAQARAVAEQLEAGKRQSAQALDEVYGHMNQKGNVCQCRYGDRKYYSKGYQHTTWWCEIYRTDTNQSLTRILKPIGASNDTKCGAVCAPKMAEFDSQCLQPVVTAENQKKILELEAKRATQNAQSRDLSLRLAGLQEGIQKIGEHLGEPALAPAPRVVANAEKSPIEKTEGRAFVNYRAARGDIKLLIEDTEMGDFLAEPKRTLYSPVYTVGEKLDYRISFRGYFLQGNQYVYKTVTSRLSFEVGKRYDVTIDDRGDVTLTPEK